MDDETSNPRTVAALAKRLDNLQALAANIMAGGGGGVADVETMTVDGPGLSVSLYDSRGTRVLQLNVEDPEWRIDENGRIYWRRT